jgi:hypothetical protein
LTWRPLWAAVVFALFLVPVWGFTATSSVTWMRMLDLETIRTTADVWNYLIDLRTGIPPVLSTLELLWWVAFRDLTLFSDVLYPITIAAAFTLAVLTQPGVASRVAVLIAGLFLARVGVEVHAGNPANYDPIFALLTLGYFLLVRRWSDRRRVMALVGGGLCLALLELTRPFMIFLLPVFVAVEVHRIAVTSAGQRGAALAAYLLPVVVLSGGWHLHVWLAHDHQITWTNISGFNLQRAWEDFDPEIAAVRHLDQLPRVREGENEQWADLNTSEIHRESEDLKALIVGKILDDPARAARHVLNRLATFASAPTKMYGSDPQGVRITLYRGAVTGLVITLVGYVVVAGAVLIRRRRWPWMDTRWWLACSTLLVTLLVSLGEQGEEGRFLFSILPMMLAVGGFVVGASFSTGSWRILTGRLGICHS